MRWLIHSTSSAGDTTHITDMHGCYNRQCLPVGCQVTEGTEKQVSSSLQAVFIHGANGVTVDWGPSLLAGRSQVLFPMVSLEFFHWSNPFGRTMTLGSTDWGSNRNGYHYNFISYFLFCTMANKCTIISQMITFLYVSTLSCYPQEACNQYVARLHKYFKCSFC